MAQNEVLGGVMSTNWCIKSHFLRFCVPDNWCEMAFFDWHDFNFLWKILDILNIFVIF